MCAIHKILSKIINLKGAVEIFVELCHKYQISAANWFERWTVDFHATWNVDLLCWTPKKNSNRIDNSPISRRSPAVVRFFQISTRVPTDCFRVALAPKKSGFSGLTAHPIGKRLIQGIVDLPQAWQSYPFTKWVWIFQRFIQILTKLLVSKWSTRKTVHCVIT